LFAARRPLLFLFFVLPHCLSVPALRAEVPLNELSHIIITHLGPNRFPTLKAVLEEALQGRPAGSPLKLVVTNPAKSALQKGLAGTQAHAHGAWHNVLACMGAVVLARHCVLLSGVGPVGLLKVRRLFFT
jgi:hypothetical protein